MNKKEPVSFGARCRLLRKAMKMTQAQFAALMGMSNRADSGKVTVCRWETGASMPTGRTMLKFIQVEHEHLIQNGSHSPEQKELTHG